MIYDQNYYIAALVTYKTIIKNKQAIKTSLAYSNQTLLFFLFLKFEILWCPGKTPLGKMAQPFVRGYASHLFVRVVLTVVLTTYLAGPYCSGPFYQGRFVGPQIKTIF